MATPPSSYTSHINIPGDQSDQDLLQYAHKIFTPVSLPCGRVVPNRLVKASMYEHFAPIFGSAPHDGILALYEKWAEGNWGMVMTGNVQVAKDHLPLGRDMIVPDELNDVTLAPWRALANVIHYGAPAPVASTVSKVESAGRPVAIIQLSHGGRQSLNFTSGRMPFAPPLAPSPIRLGADAAKEGWISWLAHRLMLQEPREMTFADIRHAVQQFVHGAKMAVEGGFDGVEIHAAHGYLVSQFISTKSNRRTDEYSAERDALHFLRDIVFAIRAPGVVPDDFVVGVKLNSADYSQESGTASGERPLNHVREIGKWGLVDYIQVSGGDYEDPQFIDAVEKSRSPRQVLFEAFAAQSMDVLASCVPTATNRPPPVVMLTGGLNTLPRMTSVLVHNHAHLLGVARLAVTCPRLPAELSTALATGDTESFMTEPPQPTELGVAPPSYLSARGAERLLYYVLKLLWMLIPGRVPRIVGASASVNWYNVMLRRIAFGQEIDWTLGTIGSTIRCYLAPTPYLPKEGDAAWRWWAGMTVLGIAMGVGLGRVI